MIEDLADGQYLVKYVGDVPGEYNIEVKYVNEDAVGESIRGFPSKSTFTDQGKAEDNDFTGKLVVDYLQKKLVELDKWTSVNSAGIETQGTDYDTNVKTLLSVKEHIQKINESKHKNLLDLEIIEQILKNFEKAKTPRNKDAEFCNKLIRELNSLEKRGEATEKLIQTNIKSEASKRKDEIKQFEDILKNYLLQLKTKAMYKYATGCEAAQAEMEIVNSIVEQYKVSFDDYDYYAKMFEYPEVIEQAKKNLEMISKDTGSIKGLWFQIKKIQDLFEEWLDMGWEHVDGQEMADKLKVENKLLTGLPNLDRKSNVFMGIAADIKNWNIFLPLVQEMKSEAMAAPDDRHWNKVRELLSTDFQIDNELKLRKFWECEIYTNKYKEFIEECTEQAKQESKIEQNLEKIEGFWVNVDWGKVPLELKDCTINQLKIDDESAEVLEEHQLTMQTIAASKFMAHFEEKVTIWQKGLSLVSDTVADLADVQKTWSFLINLFIYSDEVKKELPDESEEFVGIDKQVRQILKDAETHTNIFEFCTREDPEDGKTVWKKMQTIFKELAKCQKGLNDFLASKRKVFPRFYFLTMDELLDVLANGNNPYLLFAEKNYMNKVVQAGDKLKMDVVEGKPSIIRSMNAFVGVETVIFPGGGLTITGKVENYLNDILNGVLKAIKDQAKLSNKEWAQKKEKVAWITENYAQLNLLTNNINWVVNTESALERLQKGELDALKVLHQTIVDGLNALIIMVQGKLEKSVRTKIMCLITIDTHNRDIIEILIAENVRKSDEFQWASQLKFYWDTKEDDCQIAICDARLWYYYEYLGNGNRLVVTPLTDRIYVTATQALHLKMGCAPAGPAGTGKTETTKDLSSAVGKACYVFNCSPEMSFEAMGITFKGLAASGCWGCFDEFNRLIPEVLSVCSVQYKAVTDAIKAGKERFIMEGDEVELDPTNGAFITMNPGYLGRAELPEGLKALFRPITVVVPDLRLICENILMAEGFIEAKVLATKFTVLYSLCSALLSKQDHYDWGLRAIKSVLVVAGEFKRGEPDQPEGGLLFRALRDFNYPKIASID